MFEQGLWNTLCFKEHAQHYYTRHIHSSSGLSHLQHGPHQPQSYWLFRWADWQRLSCLVLECGRQTDIWESGCGGGGGSRWRAEQKMKSSRHTSMSKYFERSGHSAVRCCYSSRFFFSCCNNNKILYRCWLFEKGSRNHKELGFIQGIIGKREMRLVLFNKCFDRSVEV